MTAKRNTDVVPVTDDMMRAVSKAENKGYTDFDCLIAHAIDASPELTKLIAENEQLILDNARMRAALVEMSLCSTFTAAFQQTIKQALGEQP